MKDTGLLSRFYSTNGYQDGGRSKDTFIRESLRIMESPRRETLRQRFESSTRQNKKSSSIQRLEPCYQPIYPRQRRKATLKIPKKPPCMPAVYQKRTTSCKNKYHEMVPQPVRGRYSQWPPLYPTKRKDQPQNKQTDKSNELPPWLLPLYSCKSNSNETPSISEVRYSGAAFHRKMEIIESIKHIRANQPQAIGHQKEAKNDEKTLPEAKTVNTAVEALKRKIDSMQSYLIAVKKLEAHRKRYERTSNELPEDREILKQAYSRIYQKKPPSLPRERRVMKSMGTATAEPKAFEKPQPGTSNPLPEQAAEKKLDVDINKAHVPKIQQEEGSNKNEGESNISKQTNNKHIPAERTSNLSLGQIHKESVVMIRQPSWKTQQILNGPMINDPKANQLRASAKPAKEESTKDASMAKQRSRNIKIQDIKSEEEANKTAGNALTVESLKTRINVMKINKSAIEDPRAKKAEDMSGTKNGGEIKPKISQVALRSFHREVGSKYPINAQSKDVTKLRLGYQRTVGRRNFSTTRHPTVERVARGSGHKRKNICTTQATSKKITWLKRLKKCFALERIRIPKCENWKETPREIPYEKKEAECISPAPVLWKPVLEEHQGKHRSKPTTVTTERVNPAIINAERRILASIGKVMTAKSQNNIPGVRVIDIEKKISKAKHKVDMMPWLKESKSHDNWPRLLQLRGCDVKLEQDEPPGTGYEWILKNKEIVEDLKRQSRCAAGKSLVPIEVKNSINEYKLSLRADISRYRTKIDRKCSDVYLYSTSKRWYSTSYAGKHRKILPSTDVFQVKKRGVKTAGYRREVINPGKFVDRKTRPDKGINARKHNQVGRKTEDLYENPEGNSPKKWAWKVPNKTRAFTPRPTALTSPNKTSTARMSEMSSSTLKKQVKELKRLIKKAREEVAERTEEPPTVSQADSYETRLKRLIKAAHNNAQKMQIVEPKYTSENNMMANRPSSGIRANPQPIQYDAKMKSKPEASVLKSLFIKNDGEPKSLADEIVLRNNLTSMPGKKPEKTISSRVYIKLKSLVEAVRRKSAMMDAISGAKLLPPPNLKGNMGATVLPMKQSVKPTEENKNEDDPVTVELLAESTPAPSKTIQLWKGESKPREFEFSKKDPTYGDLMNLFSKAKEIFYYQPPQLEISKNWLSIREDVSKATKAVSELKNPSDGLGYQQNFSLSSPPNPGTDPLTEFMMTKSKILPMEILKSDGKISCGMWSNVPIIVQENEDLCGKTSEDDVYESTSHPSSPVKEPTYETKPSTSNQYETSFIQEPRKFLFQKPLTTWESISQNFSCSLGRNLFGKPAENPYSARPEAIVNSTPVADQDPKTGETSDTLQQSRSEITQDNGVHCQSPAKVPSESSDPGNMQKTDSQHSALSIKKETSLSSVEQSCAPNLGPLEDKVRKWENYYRHHFAEDVISMFEHLHQVYGDLDKMNKELIDTDDCKRMGTGKDANDHIDSISDTASQKTAAGVGSTVNEKNDGPDFHGAAQIQSNHRFVTKSSHNFGPPQSIAIPERIVDASGNSQSENSQVSYEISNEAERTTHQNGEQICANQTFNKSTRVIRIKVNSEPSKQSGDAQGAELLQPGKLAELVQEDYSARPSNEFGDQQEKKNFDDLLSQDPTLNPEVVKKLKLPVIMSDDSHAEKNWYTKVQSGSHQNHFNE